jgi:hypothetical protein
MLKSPFRNLSFISIGIESATWSRDLNPKQVQLLLLATLNIPRF